MAKLDLKAYALQGAAVRVGELREELAAIYRAFPVLRKGNIDGGFTRRRLANTDGGTTLLVRRKRKRKPMMAAQRAEVSRRMKKYWAARRKAE